MLNWNALMISVSLIGFFTVKWKQLKVHILELLVHVLEEDKLVMVHMVDTVTVTVEGMMFHAVDPDIVEVHMKESITRNWETSIHCMKVTELKDQRWLWICSFCFQKRPTRFQKRPTRSSINSWYESINLCPYISGRQYEDLWHVRCAIYFLFIYLIDMYFWKFLK